MSLNSAVLLAFALACTVHKTHRCDNLFYLYNVRSSPRKCLFVCLDLKYFIRFLGLRMKESINGTPSQSCTYATQAAVKRKPKKYKLEQDFGKL